MLGSPQPVCVVCGGPRDYRKRETCSDKCRAALSRRRLALTQTMCDQETRAAREAIAHADEAPGGKVRMTFRVLLSRQHAEVLAAMAVRAEKNIGTLVTEIIEAATVRGKA